MSFIGNGVGRQMIMPGQIAPAAVGMSQLDSTLSNTFSLRNRIINGDCRVAQRGSVTVAAGQSVYGGPDRFLGANSATGSFTQASGTITYGGISRPAIVQTVVTPPTSITGSSYWYGIAQRIEGFNCYDLLGQQASISFIFNTNVTGTYSVALVDGSYSNSFVTSFSATANTPIKISIPIASLPANLSVPVSNALGMTLIIGAAHSGTFSTSALGSWQSANMINASGTTNWASTASNFISATEIQLEAGPTTTPFERRSYGFELALCQRYFETSYDVGVAPGTANQMVNMDFLYMTNLSSGNPATGMCTKFKVTKRAVPSITVYSPNTGASGKVYSNTGAADVTPSIANNGTQGFIWYATTPGAATTVVNMIAHWAVSAEL